ncbi:MAG: cytochrome ubiquinol oxidase subunit I [Betaproteobacteria bacterium]|nr:cytochrome ubiquinol oxidase subunit I [Betaproteobacteria bacterium]
MPLDIPLIGARTALWLVAQIHLFLAAFVLGAPIFIVISEWLGLQTRDPRYERLARETMKVVAIAYSLTAVFGVLFAFVLMGPYQLLTNYLFRALYPVWALYGLFILLETVCMYLYWYTWGPLSATTVRKWMHIGIGVVLNVLGTIVMLLMNAVAGFMNTPPKAIETATLWELVNNAAWWPLNLHRFLGNITFGGFVVALFAAFMFLTSRTGEDRKFYDWMGYIGNLIGVGALMTMPLAGYVLAKELFLYDAQLATFMMADKLSGYFVMQGLLVVLLFLGANFYMWLSMQRIEGGPRFAPHMKAVFGVLLAGGVIWVVPQNFFPDLLSKAPPGVSEQALILPERFAFLGLMVAKALAVTAIIIMTFVTYLLYRRARATGRIVWGRIDPMAQYVLIFIPAVAVYLMGLMGAIRSLTRMDYHVYGALKDLTPYWYVVTLGHSSVMAAITTVSFFLLLVFVFWVGFVMGKAHE